MNLTIGCKQDGKYHLMNGEYIAKEEWTSLVRNHISKNGNEEIFSKIQSTVSLWNKHDTLEETALQVYASRFCTNLQIDKRCKFGVPVTVVTDGMGCKQLSFI